jgi:ADP-sugar diphosphatase
MATTRPTVYGGIRYYIARFAGALLETLERMAEVNNRINGIEVSDSDSENDYEHDLLQEAYEYNGVTLNAASVHILPYLETVNNSPKYRFWVDQFKEQNQLVMKRFVLTDVPNFFGPKTPERLGFFKGYGEVYDAATKEVIPSNIAFCRGECDACLVVARVKLVNEQGIITEKKMIPLVEQARFASGGYRVEAMAGMRDERTGSLKGPIVTEMEQEFGIKISEDDPRLKRLPGSKSWPSPGGCDEAIYHWYFEMDIDEAKYHEMCTRTYGEGDHEKIRIRFFDWDTIDETLNEIGDYKASDMVRRYRYCKRKEEEEMAREEPVVKRSRRGTTRR